MSSRALASSSPQRVARDSRTDSWTSGPGWSTNAMRGLWSDFAPMSSLPLVPAAGVRGLMKLQAGFAPAPSSDRPFGGRNVGSSDRRTRSPTDPRRPRVPPPGRLDLVSLSGLQDHDLGRALRLHVLLEGCGIRLD